MRPAPVFYGLAMAGLAVVLGAQLDESRRHARRDLNHVDVCSVLSGGYTVECSGPAVTSVPVDIPCPGAPFLSLGFYATWISEIQPEDIGYLAGCLYVFIVRNNWSPGGMGFSVAGMTNLWNLLVTNSSIHELVADSFVGLPALTTAELSFNKMTGGIAPGTFGDLPALTSLGLKFNELEYLQPMCTSSGLPALASIGFSDPIREVKPGTWENIGSQVANFNIRWDQPIGAAADEVSRCDDDDSVLPTNVRCDCAIGYGLVSVGAPPDHCVLIGTRSPVTSHPTWWPSPAPTASPTTVPPTSGAPTQGPTSPVPTPAPSPRPSSLPSVSPNPPPTPAPSASPTTLAPSAAAPTRDPTMPPSLSPTLLLSVSPSPPAATLYPSSGPTPSPSTAPSTLGPTGRPSVQPSSSPSRPTSAPTGSPAHRPTSIPTPAPTPEPSPAPTMRPTRAPSKIPSMLPSRSLTFNPTAGPSQTPSALPTEAPTTGRPTIVPSTSPSTLPTSLPTASPSRSPTFNPTAGPSRTPSTLPTKDPTTDRPTFVPSTLPTSWPTAPPSRSPTFNPTAGPSRTPSALPTEAPTVSPSIAWLVVVPDLIGSRNSSACGGIPWATVTFTLSGTAETPCSAAVEHDVLEQIVHESHRRATLSNIPFRISCAKLTYGSIVVQLSVDPSLATDWEALVSVMQRQPFIVSRVETVAIRGVFVANSRPPTSAPTNHQPPDESNSGRESNPVTESIIVLAVVAVIALLGIMLLWWFVMKKKSHPNEPNDRRRWRGGKRSSSTVFPANALPHPDNDATEPRRDTWAPMLQPMIQTTSFGATGPVGTLASPAPPHELPTLGSTFVKPLKHSTAEAAPAPPLSLPSLTAAPNQARHVRDSLASSGPLVSIAAIAPGLGELRDMPKPMHRRTSSTNVGSEHHSWKSQRHKDLVIEDRQD